MKISTPKLIVLFLLVFSLEAGAQLRFSKMPRVPVTNNELRQNLEKIVKDFPRQFSGIKGDTLEVNPQTIEYSAIRDFSLAPQNSVFEYRGLKPKFSWQGLFLSTEEFDEASKKYDWLYKQLKAMTLKLDGGYSFTLDGDYEAPDEGKGFSTSVFKLTPNASNIPKLKIELSMNYEFPEWKVSLMVYEKEREDNERGVLEEF